jgi:hypothetical protein
VKVFLDESDVERSKRVTDVRNSKNQQVPNYRETRQMNDWATHYAGVRGEVAVCKVFGFPLDEHFAYGGDDGAPDLYVGPYRVEVKTAVHDPPILKLNRLTDFKADFIILCYAPPMGHRDESIVTLAGVVSRKTFLEKHYVRDFDQGDRVCMDAAKMGSVEDFIKWAGQLPPDEEV